MNHSDQKQYEGRVYFNLQTVVHSQRSPRQELKAETGTKAMELSPLLPGLLLYLSYSCQVQLPKDGTAYSGLDPLT